MTCGNEPTPTERNQIDNVETLPALGDGVLGRFATDAAARSAADEPEQDLRGTTGETMTMVHTNDSNRYDSGTIDRRRDSTKVRKMAYVVLSAVEFGFANAFRPSRLRDATRELRS